MTYIFQEWRWLSLYAVAAGQCLCTLVVPQVLDVLAVTQSTLHEQVSNIRLWSLKTANQVAHVNCGQCHTTLMYPYGAPSVKCAICHFVTNVGTRSNTMQPVPVYTPNGPMVTPALISGQSLPHPHSQTVVVENPMSVDDSGKLVLPSVHLHSAYGFYCNFSPLLIK
ncbi:hypothetical protein Taro_007691 [Colocasia esculenta]|uniref:Zinc finger LSD1-type domain-containing protein n=1 Tax=Colocasia esculenta TaxID=4460 RepID=A0A843U0E4_COLES|nr:hypothetical protein [Colocasia esculenta]